MRKNLKINTLLLLFITGICLSACSDNDDTPTVQEDTTNYYALLTGDMTTSPYVGYATTYTEIPSGSIDNVKSGSLAIQTNGMQSFGKWVFKRSSLASQSKDDLIRYSVDASGNLKEDGRISSGLNSNYYIYNDTLGFYLDADRSLLKIQKFNPSSMERSGDIDLSAIRDQQYGYQDIGTSLIVAKEGKLYVDIFSNKENEKGNFFINEPLGFVQLAVVDIASGKYEKTIRRENISYIGYPGNENQMWGLGDDGALYFCSHGFGATGAINGSAIVRIKKGDTDFDKEWIIKADDYTKGTSFGTVCVKDDKLYTSMSSQALAFTTLLTDVSYSYYAFNKENIAQGPTKISDIPLTTYPFQCAQSITAIDDKVYFRVVNNADKNGYYVLGDNNTATQVFNVASGGVVWGFCKLVVKAD
ncbi:hypothetical protein [Parabacteroides sp. Marseille-P3160]|uniref:hypothetical protein n=1 Tax=Parabacteroides sp. Marseille-P3160 TaxID=1917887 RepID=UPI0009BB9D80|nr:hypothetical protein [Parabacteroides sp. Marseille-P3160]